MAAACVLVTGGAGYIGSHVCKALADNGFQPVTFDSMEAGHEWAVKWGPLERGDMRESDRLCELLRRYRPTAVMHFAAYIAAGESVTDPGKYYFNNVAGSLSLLEAMRRADVKHLVFSSTAAVYGMPESVPISESHPLKPINPYGTSKLMIETILRDYVTAYGFHVAAMRYFNAAGADHRAGIGECHDPETHLIPRVLAAAACQLDGIVVNGVDYPTPDGTCIRDYVHVSDLAEAHVLALKWSKHKSQFDAFNLGGGAGHSVRQIIDVARQVTQKEIVVRTGPRREGDPPTLVSDIARAVRDLGWKPRQSSLEQLVSDAWQWHRGVGMRRHGPARA